MFSVAASGKGTMFGSANYMSKVMTTVMSMEKMVGPDFEAGLAKLKAAVEK